MRSAALSPQVLSQVMAIQTDEIVVTFCVTLGFIVLYTMVAPWWRYPVARGIVALDAALSLTLLPSVIHHLFGFRAAEDAVFAWFTVVAFGLVPCVIVWRAWILIRMQRAHLHDPPDPGADPHR